MRNTEGKFREKMMLSGIAYTYLENEYTFHEVGGEIIVVTSGP